MRRLSLQATLGPRNGRGRGDLFVSLRGTGWPPAPEQLLDVPKGVMVENGRPEVAQSLRRPNEHIRADEADDRQVLRDQLLDAIVQALAKLDVAGGELTPHQRVDFGFPGRGRLALS